MNKPLSRIFHIILCHHTKESSSHCIKIQLLGTTVPICSRCLGIYPFALLWLMISLKFNIRFSYTIEKKIILYLFFPAFFEWTLSGLKLIKSNNVIRFSSGIIASISLSRWWFLYIRHYYLDIVIYIVKIYSVAVIIILLLLWKINSNNIGYSREE